MCPLHSTLLSRIKALLPHIIVATQHCNVLKEMDSILVRHPLVHCSIAVLSAFWDFSCCALWDTYQKVVEFWNLGTNEIIPLSPLLSSHQPSVFYEASRPIFKVLPGSMEEKMGHAAILLVMSISSLLQAYLNECNDFRTKEIRVPKEEEVEIEHMLLLDLFPRAALLGGVHMGSTWPWHLGRLA